MKAVRSYEVRPTNGQKSFYGRAVVTLYEDGSEVLKSYNTNVLMHDGAGKWYRLWSGFSVTTGKHIKAWCNITPQEYKAMTVTPEAIGERE